MTERLPRRSPGDSDPDVAAFSAFAAILPEPHWLLTAEGTVVCANSAAEAIIGRSAAEVAGAPLQALVTDEPGKLARYLAMCSRSRDMVPGAIALRTADGSEVAYRCEGALLREPALDTPPLVLVRCRPRDAAASRFVTLTERVDALNREIIRREQAERVLRQQAELLDQTHDAIFVWELGGGLTYLNRAAQELYGWPRAEALGRRPHDLFRTQAAIPMAEVERLLQGTGEWRGELVHTSRDGREVMAESRMVLLQTGEGHAPLVLETLRDVTETRRARAQLEAAKRLEAVGQLAGGAAHEINNALQGALGFSALALRRLPADDPAREDIEQSLKSSQRAAAVTQGLLAFSRRQLLQPSDVRLDLLIQEFAPLLRQTLGPDRDLVLDLPRRPVTVHADRGQLEQVLLNFVLNARDATEVGGRTTVRVTTTALTHADLAGLGRSELAPGAYARIDVADDGHGMTAAVMAKVFEPFFTTKAPGQGTGLGLAVVHGIVHQSGGALGIWSTPGQGTTFSAYLPEVPTSVSASAVADTSTPGGAEWILVVDDEPVVLEFTQRLLEAEGYTVLTAVNGAEALERLGALATLRAYGKRVDLVVTDIVMPVLGGRAFGIVLADRYPELPVLYTSGHPREEMVRRGLLVEGAAFIQKPFSPEQLLGRVRTLVDRANT